MTSRKSPFLGREGVPALVLAALLAVVLPLQTFLGNASIYPFSLARLLPESFVLFVAFSAGLLLVRRLFSIADGSSVNGPSAFFMSVLTALACCTYLESGILSAGLPELNGGFVAELENVRRKVFDAFVWVVLIGSFAAYTRWIREYLHWISLAVLVLSLASLLDVCGSAESTTVSAPYGAEKGFEDQPTVVANVKYSPTRNILIFILDSMPAYGVAAAVRTNAALTAKFDGFTAYTYNIGMHECTKRGVPGLVTGHYYDPKEMSPLEYPLTMYGTNSFLTVADAIGWNVAFSPDLLPYGFINLPVERSVRRETRRSRDVLAILRQSTEVPHLTLFDMVSFRMAPFFFKAPILYSRIRHAVSGRHSNDDFWGEKQMYPALAERPVNDDGKPFLGVFHSWGAHPPLENGFVATVTDKLTRLGALLDAYRENGVYDKSMILVTTDHGRNDTMEVDGYPDHASALLWVKPEGAHGPWTESDVRTSHAKIAPLIRKSLTGEELSAEDVRETLKATHRLYRAPAREGMRRSFRDWVR